MAIIQKLQYQLIHPFGSEFKILNVCLALKRATLRRNEQQPTRRLAALPPKRTRDIGCRHCMSHSAARKPTTGKPERAGPSVIGDSGINEGREMLRAVRKLHP